MGNYFLGLKALVIKGDKDGRDVPVKIEQLFFAIHIEWKLRKKIRRKNFVWVEREAKKSRPCLRRKGPADISFSMRRIQNLFYSFEAKINTITMGIFITSSKWSLHMKYGSKNVPKRRKKTFINVFKNEAKKLWNFW